MRRSARPTTSSAMPVSIRPWGGRRRAGAGAAGGASFSDIFGDVFGDIFGGGRGGGGQRVYRGADLRYNLELSLEDAVAGTEVKIRVPTMVQCGTCDGSGARKGSKPTPCTTCGGHGQVRMQQGFFSLQQTCPHCQGTRHRHFRPLPGLSRPGPGQRTQDPVGESTGRCRYR